MCPHPMTSQCRVAGGDSAQRQTGQAPAVKGAGQRLAQGAQAGNADLLRRTQG